MSAEDVARHAVDGAEHDRRVVVPGRLNRGPPSPDSTVEGDSPPADRPDLAKHLGPMAVLEVAGIEDRVVGPEMKGVVLLI